MDLGGRPSGFRSDRVRGKVVAMSELEPEEFGRASRSSEAFIALMREIAQFDEAGLFVEQEDASVWQVMFEADDPSVMIELDDARQLAAFSCDLGQPTMTDCSRLDALALEYSALHRTTGGVRVAKLNGEGHYWLLADLGLGALSRENFAAVVRGFSGMAKSWTEIVNRGVTNSKEALRQLASSKSFIRV